MANVTRIKSRVRREEAESEIVVPLGRGRSVAVSPAEDRALLRVSGGGDDTLEIEISFSAAGPLVKMRAHTIELEQVENVRAQCGTFEVDARERIELRTQGAIVQQASEGARMSARTIELDASPGAIRLKANDEVQLEGEMILLNSERPKLMPAWVEKHTVPGPSLDPAEESGDADVIRELRAREPAGRRE